MSKVLYIKANGKTQELSRTYRVADSFVKAYQEANPDDEIITLDLYEEGISFLPQGDMNEVHRPGPGEGEGHPILKYAFQFASADKYIVAEPLWNLGIPAILKAYIDYITVVGITFKYTESGAVGLCTGKKAVNITSRGGTYLEGPAAGYEMGDKYLKILFGFYGIYDFRTIVAEGLDVVGADIEAIVQNAIKEAQVIAKTF